jgi:hypothetical protein
MQCQHCFLSPFDLFFIQYMEWKESKLQMVANGKYIELNITSQIII